MLPPYKGLILPLGAVLSDGFVGLWGLDRDSGLSPPAAIPLYCCDFLFLKLCLPLDTTFYT